MKNPKWNHKHGTFSLYGEDLSIMLTCLPEDGIMTALLTVRGKDHDLTPAQLRRFAAAMLGAANALDAATGKE